MSFFPFLILSILLNYSFKDALAWYVPAVLRLNINRSYTSLNFYGTRAQMFILLVGVKRSFDANEYTIVCHQRHFLCIMMAGLPVFVRLLQGNLKTTDV